MLRFGNKTRNILLSRRNKSVSRDLQQLGASIKSGRQRPGWTVRQLADAAGLVPSTVFGLENA
jgi:hypothetical protein